jgi:hypothetical protein
VDEDYVGLRLGAGSGLSIEDSATVDIDGVATYGY